MSRKQLGFTVIFDPEIIAPPEFVDLGERCGLPPDDAVFFADSVHRRVSHYFGADERAQWFAKLRRIGRKVGKPLHGHLPRADRKSVRRTDFIKAAEEAGSLVQEIDAMAHGGAGLFMFRIIDQLVRWATVRKPRPCPHKHPRLKFCRCVSGRLVLLWILISTNFRYCTGLIIKSLRLAGTLVWTRRSA